MLIEKVGRITDRIDLLGGAEIPFYLVKGDDWAMVDAGVSPAIPALFEQLKGYPEIDRKLKSIILTHSHFDHAGGLQYLLGRFPGAQVIASKTAAEVFAKPKAVEYILTINSNLAKFGGIDFEKLGLRTEPLRVDRVASEGGRIDLGAGVNLEVFDAPGHSRCSLAYVLNPDRALFSGEAIGFRNRPDQVMPEALSSFNDFIRTLEKLARLDLALICLPHGGVLAGEEVKGYFALALAGARDFQREFRERIKNAQPDSEILDSMTKEYYIGKIKLQPEMVFRGNLQSMLNVVKKEMPGS